MSITTLWRARSSKLEGFPTPVIVQGAVFWRKADLDQLEDALLKFKGRGVFERNREAERKLKRLRAAKPAAISAKPPRAPQRDLFD
ncbi:hypothetical protein [Vitreimonas flagellata]|uniref:hypothetical protein n=1 Tax=Vitreimonas flagellata TaxID=2560861 RepID=UPI0010757B15|nr:hypothetical protein [Vitreimonas flagellata]